MSKYLAMAIEAAASITLLLFATWLVFVAA